MRDLVCEEICSQSGKSRTSWGEEDTDVTDVDREAEESKYVPYDTARNHESGI